MDIRIDLTNEELAAKLVKEQGFNPHLCTLLDVRLAIHGYIAETYGRYASNPEELEKSVNCVYGYYHSIYCAGDYIRLFEKYNKEKENN